MSKIQEAIEHFKSLQKRYTTQHNGKQCEFVASALNAMNDQAEREKGCELCHSEAINRAEITRSYGKAHIALVCGGEPDKDSKFSFCPMCGRDLRKPVSK